MSAKATLLGLSTAVALMGCAATPPDPTGRASADMTRVLAELQRLGAKPVYTLTVDGARQQATPGDAAAQVAIAMGVPPKVQVAQVQDISIRGSVGPLPARVYTPTGTGNGPAPVILYFHGGGWVTGTLDTYDASDRVLASMTGAIVVSVQYRRGPENRFPAAQDDADAAYGWLVSNAATIGGDPRRIALAGESAGGNMALDTAIWARDQHIPMPVHVLAVYPVAGTNLDTPSYRETTDAIPLNRRAIEWYVKNYTNGSSDLQDPRLNIVGAADVHGLPPTTIVSAEIDPLRSEGEALAQKMQAAGVNVSQRTFPGVTHEFFGMGAVVQQAKAAEDYASQRLKASFDAPVPDMATTAPQRPARRPMRRPALRQ